MFGVKIVKKILTILAILLGLAAAAGYGTYKVLDNVENYQEENPDNESLTAAAPKDEESPYATEREEYEEQTKNIGGQFFALELTDDTMEGDIIDIMHKMTHQKVKAEDKWGAIPLSEDTVSQVIEFLGKSNFASKEALIDIANKWKSGDFQTIDDDHNYFWQWQGGTVGRAYGIMSPAEEEEFIRNNF